MTTTESGLKFEVIDGTELLGRFNHAGAALLRLKLRAGLYGCNKPELATVEKAIAENGFFRFGRVEIWPSIN